RGRARSTGARSRGRRGRPRRARRPRAPRRRSRPGRRSGRSCRGRGPRRCGRGRRRGARGACRGGRGRAGRGTRERGWGRRAGGTCGRNAGSAGNGKGSEARAVCNRREDVARWRISVRFRRVSCPSFLDPPANPMANSYPNLTRAAGRFGIIAGGVLLLILIAAGCMTKSIGAGEQGVKYSYFSGTNLGESYGEGFHVFWPWEQIIDYDVRVNNQDEE